MLYTYSFKVVLCLQFSFSHSYFVPLPIITRAIFIVYHLFLTNPLRAKTFVLHFLLSSSYKQNNSYVFLYSHIMVYRYMYLLALKNSFLAFGYFKPSFFVKYISLTHSTHRFTFPSKRFQ